MPIASFFSGGGIRFERREKPEKKPTKLDCFQHSTCTKIQTHDRRRGIPYSNQVSPRGAYLLLNFVMVQSCHFNGIEWKVNSWLTEELDRPSE